MSPADGGHVELIGGFPRVSGDEPGDSHPARITRVFSPRERG